jgi:hypothetical protein
MKELHTEIQIEAPSSSVWQVLTDFQNYDKWNPFISSIKGDLRSGAKLEVRMHPPNEKKEFVFSPTVINVEENKELRWLGKGAGGMFNGEHRFAIEQINDKQVKFIQSEKFTGLLVGLAGKRLDTNTRQGFEEMNLALKARAEKGNKG